MHASLDDIATAEDVITLSCACDGGTGRGLLASPAKHVKTLVNLLDTAIKVMGVNYA